MPPRWIALALIASLACTTAARADVEHIIDFISDVRIEPDSTLLITERISFQVLLDEIRHGINRDFPTDYRGPLGSRSTTGFDLRDVRLEDGPVPAQLLRLQNGVRVRIGDPERLLLPRIHTYT